MTQSTQMRRPCEGAIKFMALGAMALLVLGCGKTAPPTELKVEVEKTPVAAPAANAAAETAAPVVPVASTVAADTVGTTAPAEAIKAAAAKGLYVALVLQKKGAPDPGDMVAAVRSLAKESGKAECIVADVGDPSLATLFRSLALDTGTVPAPATLMLSTNSIITGAFTVPPTKERFAEALLPVQPLAVLSALRDGKKAVVVVQAPTTKGNAETDKGIEEYLASITNRASYAVVKIALDNADNAPFLRQLKIDSKSETESVTILMAPPMSIAAPAMRGAVTKEVFGKAMSACASASCGPAG